MPDRPAPVAILTLHYPPEVSGNAPYTGSLARGLASQGHEVSVHTAQPHYPEWEIHPGYDDRTRHERIDGVDVTRRRHYVPRPPRGIRRLLSELSFGWRLLTGRLGIPDDAVVIAVSPALFSTWLAARRSGRRPLIVWVQDLYSLGLAETGEGGGLVTRITRAVERRTLRSADRVVVIHERFARYVSQDLGVDVDRVEVVRNWTHLPPAPYPSKQDARAALDWPREVPIALHSGNMGAKQGLENVVDAARMADARGADVLFVLVGDGGQRSELEARAVGIERIRFIDPLSDKLFRAALAAADVLLVNEKPGVAAMSVPSKLTSYFDSGRPVVAAAESGGITGDEINAAGAGPVVPPGHPEALLAAVLALLADPDEAERLGAAERAYRESTLGEQAALDQWNGLIADAAGHAPMTRP